MRDVDGNVFIDCLAGAGALNVGHNNPDVLEAIRKALDSEHIMTSLDLPNGPKDMFTTLLLSLLPEPLRSRARTQFCGPTGTDAVDAALKLVKTATGRQAVIAFQGAYHGMGQGPLSLMGAPSPKEALAGLLPGSPLCRMAIATGAASI
ncbi:MAG TPA: aminotransferase class III-fold pyridoxal phosphate-dependent enzyme [Chloroflexota bacterium]|nr:aminotransferase class III-fold pyridoxal phosphate-dependent enzyme [Chloroflexota bacterium]